MSARSEAAGDAVVETRIRLELPDRPGSLALVARVLGVHGIDIRGIEVRSHGDGVVVDDFVLVGDDVDGAISELEPYVQVLERLERSFGPAGAGVDASGAALDMAERLRRPAVMGILNVTPDSFSDGGVHLEHVRAAAAARQMVAEGAALIDVGGESTRPGAVPVSVEDELRRVVPVLEAVSGVPLSIDTSKAPVARAAIEHGARFVNDVTALRGDPELVGVVADAGAWLCLMHMQGEPGMMQVAPRYDDVVDEVRSFLEERLEWAVAAGVREERIVLDPGIGFGKTVEHNLTLLRQLDRLTALGRPVLVGVSRKRTLAEILGGRDWRFGAPSASVGAAVAAFARGAAVFRVHDVREHVEALVVAAAIERGFDHP